MGGVGFAALAVGCHLPPAPVVADAGTPLASAPATRAPAQDAGPFTLTPAVLDGYLRYARARLTLTSARVSELDRWAHQADAGHGRLKSKESAEILSSLQGLAHADALARADAGLPEGAFEQVDAMVRAVIDRRTLARSLNAEGEVQTFQALRDKLPADQRANLDQSFGALQQEYDAAMALTDERHRFGDAAVDLVLSREAELSQLRAQQLASWTGVKN